MTTERTLIITVARARVLLGDTYAHFSDEQIVELIIKLDGVAHAFISGSSSLSLGQDNQSSQYKDGSK